MKTKIFLATNGLCATKFVISMQKKKIEFYGMVTHEDLMANYAYVPYLKKYKIVESGGGEKNFCNLKLIEELVNEFQCDFVFCGYGHSSENPMISKIFNDKFMGPSYVSMAFLTDKLVSTVIANSLGIPVTKFYTNFDTNWILKEFENVKDHFSKNSLFNLPKLTIFDDELKLKENLLESSCLKIEKFPLFLKITNSGGGKGIFLINSIEELREKLVDNYQKQSFIHFKNDEVFTENTRISKQYFLTESIDDARHIEVQILADKYFNIFVLGGRECSNQRRRQKLIETSLEFDKDFTEEIFLKMCVCAKKLVKSVGYYGLATVEFLFSKNQFYFLEVNCRIQVEHPITELIYGLNLPYLLYRVAKNEKIFLSIKEKFKYVMGIRITAETNDFLPSTGKVNVISNPLKCKTYFSTFNGIIDQNSDSHFGYIFSFSNNRAKMIKNLLKDVNNLRIEGVCTPLLKLASFIKDQKYNKSVFELEKYTFHQKEVNLYIIFACIIYFDKNKQEKNIRYLYNQNIFTFTIYDLTDKLFIQNKNTFLILEYSFSSKKLILFFKDRSELLNYEVENECYKFRGKIFSTKFNIVKSQISGKVVEILENQVIIESMKVRHIIKIPDNVVLLIKKEDMISVGDDFYKTNETFQNKEIKLKNELQIDLLEEASVFGKNIPFEFINKPIKPIDFYISNNTNKKLVNYLLNLKETKETTFCVLMNFIFRFLKESCKNKALLYELLEERKEFYEQTNNLFVELLKCFFTNKNLEFKFEEKYFDENIYYHENCSIHKIFNHSSEILFFFENILLEIQNFLRILDIKEVKLLKNDFVYFIKINEFLETKLIHKNEVLSYKVNLKEMKNKTNFLKSPKFIDLLQFYSAEINEEIEICELFLKESFEKKEELICQKFVLTYSNELNYKLTTKVSEEISMKGYLIHFKEMYCVFIVNNKEYKNGSFGIKEDILFYLLSKFARKNLLPKIFVSNNSGARIGVVSDLFNKLELKKNDLFIKENTCEKDESVCIRNVGIQVTDKYLAYNNKILSIFGNKDTGPENLSYCILTAKESIKCYDTTLTLSYIQNMSVGIGAYLSKLSYRIIQKENTCIILTGYKALNKILKKEVYKNNLELGGDSVYKSNLMIDSFVQDDFEAIKEIFFMCEIFYKSRKRRNFYKEIKENTKTLQLEKYFCKDFNENHTELEIIELLLDSFQEYNSNYGKGVRVVRGFYKDRSIGVISAIETNLTKEICEKISDTIEKFNKEGLDMLIIANWAGFTSTKEELQGNIISFGAKIINRLVKFNQRILVYLPPFSLLKGGSYVCFDKRINKRLKMFVHPTSKITILDAEGVSEVKLKNINQKEIIFCEKHECVYRMVRNKIVDDVLLVDELQSVLERMLFCKDW